jgi:hypothetical protein
MKGYAFSKETFQALVINKIIKREKDWRPVFKETGEIVWIIYYQLILLMANILFPYFAIV